MKQQEILKKIGNILKELNEQYEYLQAEETNINDLELELFAANAKFLTDHNEILRKINAQAQNVTLSLPEHHEPDEQHTDEPEPVNSFIQLEETLLPPLAESVLNYNPQVEKEHDEATSEEYTQHAEPADYSYTETQEIHAQVEEEAEPETHHHNEPEPWNFEPAIEQEHDHSVSIEPASERDSYDYTRHEPQVNNDEHTFSLNSSYTEEEEATPTHVDLTNIESEQPAQSQEEQPVFTHEAYNPEPEEYAEPVNIAPAEPEPFAPAAITEEEPVFTHEAYEPFKYEEQTPAIEPEPELPEIQQTETITQQEIVVPAEEEKSASNLEAYEPAEEVKTFQTYTPPVTPAPVPEPEHPLSLHERLAAQLRGNNTSPAIPSQPQQQSPVSDIKSAISMNDKLLFVKDLFNGYGMAYGEAIELLNRCKSFDEADRFLKTNYVGKNHWEEKPATVDKFYAVLHRRFPA